MLSLLWNVLSQVLLPIVVMFTIGWLLDRRSRLDLGTLVKLNIYLVVPAFIFHEVVRAEIASELALRVVAFTLCIVIAMFVLSALAARIAGYTQEQLRALQLATMFYNSGNYGVPLMTLAFPGLGPALQVFVVLTQNICTFTVGLLLASSAQHRNWRAVLPMLRQVSLWAVAAGLLVRRFDIPVQQWRWFWVPIDYFHSALVGVALVTLGVQLSQARAREHLSRLSWALGLRLIVAPCIAFALLPFFKFHGEAASIMVLSAGFPTAVNTALIAHEFKADAHFAAAAVFTSTIASVCTVTGLIALTRLL
ncbi:AEC family transporter [Verrucomicrobiota bacterium sgz303538]